MIKDYGAIFQNDGVASIITTPDNKYLFVGSTLGYLKQICLESQEIVHNYWGIHGNWITCLQTTRDSKYVITDGNYGCVKRVSIEKRVVEKDFGRVFADGITAMKISPGGEKLFLGDYLGNFKLMSSTDGTTIKNFSKFVDEYDGDDYDIVGDGDHDRNGVCTQIW
jgi:hypothetical protein